MFVFWTVVAAELPEMDRTFWARLLVRIGPVTLSVPGEQPAGRARRAAPGAGEFLTRNPGPRSGLGYRDRLLQLDSEWQAAVELTCRAAGGLATQLESRLDFFQSNN